MKSLSFLNYGAIRQVNTQVDGKGGLCQECNCVQGEVSVITSFNAVSLSPPLYMLK